MIDNDEFFNKLYKMEETLTYKYCAKVYNLDKNNNEPYPVFFNNLYNSFDEIYKENKLEKLYISDVYLIKKIDNKIVFEKIIDILKTLDEEAVDVFSNKMKLKLEKSREKGKNGWYDKVFCSDEILKHYFNEHLSKTNNGNYVDLANFCMFLDLRN